MACDVCMGINSELCPICGRPGYEFEDSCPECDGTGCLERYAVNIETGEEVEVTETAWDLLPASMDAALARRQRYIRGYREVCTRCGGSGVIDRRDECDDFDEEEAMERYYKRMYESA